LRLDESRFFQALNFVMDGRGAEISAAGDIGQRQPVLGEEDRGQDDGLPV
jgi:hypothetical protein